MIEIRLATRDDSNGIVNVIRSVYDEYGFTWEEDGYHADLYDIQRSYIDEGNPFWVAVDKSGTVIGTCALEQFPAVEGDIGEIAVLNGEVRVAGASCSLERLYLPKEQRGKGLGRRLMQVAVDTAREEGHEAMEIWSDKRFGDAHRLYGHIGATVVGERICPGDPDESPEYGLVLELNRSRP